MKKHHQDSVTEISIEKESPTRSKKENICKKSNTKKILLLGVGLILMIVLASIVTYAYMYTRPGKVVLDAMRTQPDQYKATISIDGDIGLPQEIDIRKLVIDSGMSNQPAVKIDVSADVNYRSSDISLKNTIIISQDKELYVRVAGVKDVFQKTPDVDQLPESMKKLIDKLDGTWIKIDNKKLKELNMQKSIDCIVDIPHKYRHDRQYIREQEAILKKHNFINIKKELGYKDGAFGYELGIVADKLIDYMDASQDSQLSQELRNCLDSSQSKEYSEESKRQLKEWLNESNPSITLWVDAWSHELKQLKTSLSFKNTTTSKGDKETTVNIDIVPNYTSDYTVDTPVKSMTVDEIGQEIQKLQNPREQQ